jgi:hypothetical protein
LHQFKDSESINTTFSQRFDESIVVIVQRDHDHMPVN